MKLKLLKNISGQSITLVLSNKSVNSNVKVFLPNETIDYNNYDLEDWIIEEYIKSNYLSKLEWYLPDIVKEPSSLDAYISFPLDGDWFQVGEPCTITYDVKVVNITGAVSYKTTLTEPNGNIIVGDGSFPSNDLTGKLDIPELAKGSYQFTLDARSGNLSDTKTITFHTTTCPSVDVNITLYDGSTIKAKDLLPGMKVKSLNLKTLEESVATVKVASIFTADLVKITFSDNSESKFSKDHPVALNDLSFITVESLKKGDILFGKASPVEKIESVGLGEVVLIDVEPHNVYFTDGFLSHNKN